MPNPRSEHSGSFNRAVEARDEAPIGGTSTRIWVNAVLFAATVLSVLYTGSMWAAPEAEEFAWRMLPQGWVFAVPLVSILLAHEFGHYIAARIHRVPASLPYFIPMPFSPFGTMGAVIRMRGHIRSRKALLDIGASGPLAGLAVALPVLIWGLRHSEVKPITGHGWQEGQCLIYLLIKRLVVGPIPEGHDVFLHPTALAGWAGLFVTMINLLPVSQLDGGHVAFSLFGPIQNRIGRWIHMALPLLVAVIVGYRVSASFAHALPKGLLIAIPDAVWNLVDEAKHAVSDALIWLVWFALLWVLGRDHPPTERGELGAVRTAVAAACMILFVLLFMPIPLAAY